MKLLANNYFLSNFKLREITAYVIFYNLNKILNLVSRQTLNYSQLSYYLIIFIIVNLASLAKIKTLDVVYCDQNP